jgi:hypothetical protein
MSITAAELLVLLTARNQASGAVKEAKRDVESLGKSVGAAGKEMQGLDKALTMAVGGMASYLSIQGLVSFLGASTKAAASLQKELQNVAFSAAAANREFGNSVGTTASWAATVERMGNEFKMFGEEDRKHREEAEAINASHLETIIGYIKHNLGFRWILIDCCHQLDEITMKALEFSESLMLVTGQSIPALSNAKKMLETLNLLELKELEEEYETWLVKAAKLEKRIDDLSDKGNTKKSRRPIVKKI